MLATQRVSCRAGVPPATIIGTNSWEQLQLHGVQCTVINFIVVMKLGGNITRLVGLKLQPVCGPFSSPKQQEPQLQKNHPPGSISQLGVLSLSQPRQSYTNQAVQTGDTVLPSLLQLFTPTNHCRYDNGYKRQPHKFWFTTAFPQAVHSL